MAGINEADRNRLKRDFWPTLKKAIRQVPFVHDLVAAYFCALDKDTPLRVRSILVSALVYFILPTDVIPDFFAVIGFSDDIAVLSAAFAAVRTHVTPRHYAQAEQALADHNL
jgi:uncharacterized membrane protein YkvA (DUF1232 family)